MGTATDVGWIPARVTARAPVLARNPEIQALRGVAVLGVMFSHAAPLAPWLAPVLGLVELGTAVDLFFAISGFVIARSLLPDLETTSGARRRSVIRSFYIRRGLRILPSAWLWMAVVILLSIGFNRSGSFATPAANLTDAAAVLLQVANLHFHACYYGGGGLGCGNNAIYWSLALEEQFYLLLPLLAPLPRRWLVAVLCAAVAIQLPLARSPMLLMVRSDALCLGVLLALVADPCGRVAARPRAPRLLAPALLLALAVVCSPVVLGSAGWGVASLLAAGILFLAAQDCDRLMQDGHLRRGLAWLGERSFGLYLIHNPVIWAAQEVAYRLRLDAPWVQPALVAAATALLLALAQANHALVEVPLIRCGRRHAERMRGEPAP